MGDHTADVTSATDGQGDPGDAEPLGEGGKRALEAERRARRDAEQRAKEAEERAKQLETDAVRREVASSKGVPADLLTGSSREELEAHADLLLEFRGDKGDTKGKPKEALRGGATPRDADEPDVGKVADRIFSG